MFISGAAMGSSNRVHAGLTHVTDIAPTLLELARLTPPGATYQGRPIEALSGRSLMPVLADPMSRVRKPDEPLGYELAGNKALFKGNLKLVLNNPPLGDGQWHLYDLQSDPGESRDLQQALPQQFAALQEDYKAWSQANGVLPMPEGYSPVKQVLINSVFNYWWPTYWPHATAALLLLLGLPAALWLRAARRGHPA
jgi:arylsulfatase A-like enzyme